MRTELVERHVCGEQLVDRVARHAHVYSPRAAVTVDAGGGWIIFALPPAELAAHRASREGGDVELYMMCDSIETTMGELRDKGVVFDGRVTDQRWGLVTKIVLPSGARLGLYEPRHASPLLPAD
jgi:hypothetical protein